MHPPNPKRQKTMNQDLELSQELEGHEKAVRSIACLKNGSIVTGGVDSVVCVWKKEKLSEDAPETYTIDKLLQHHGDFVYCVCDAAGSEHFYSGSKDKQIYKLDYVGNPVLQFSGHDGAVCSVDV